MLTDKTVLYGSVHCWPFARKSDLSVYQMQSDITYRVKIYLQKINRYTYAVRQLPSPAFDLQTVDLDPSTCVLAAKENLVAFINR